jgi:hypothetical protein
MPYVKGLDIPIPANIPELAKNKIHLLGRVQLLSKCNQALNPNCRYKTQTHVVS